MTSWHINIAGHRVKPDFVTVASANRSYITDFKVSTFQQAWQSLCFAQSTQVDARNKHDGEKLGSENMWYLSCSLLTLASYES